MAPHAMPQAAHLFLPCPGRPARVLAAVTALLAAGCDLPRDPDGTLDRVRNRTLRVGVAEAEPWIVRQGEEAGGPEAELVAAFAASLGARIEWRWGPAGDQLAALERRELDLVAAGLTRDSPWRHRVAFTRPWREAGEQARVLAAPPGENATLVALERIIESRREGGP